MSSFNLNQFNTSYVNDEHLPLLVRPQSGDRGLCSIPESLLTTQLHQHGAVLLRGFEFEDAKGFSSYVDRVAGPLLSYVNGSTPRTRVHGEVYTSTEYPSKYTIVQHNEMAYSLTWPATLWFCCLQPADKGGITPLTDSRALYQRMPVAIREKFERYGVKYVRNYRPFIDLSWQKSFNTSSKDVVESICRAANIQFVWHGDELKTIQYCQGVAIHPMTGEKVWFNQAHLFHSASMDAYLREALLAIYQEEDLPRNAFYGNGEPIPESEIQVILEAISQSTIRYPWQKGDLLVVDNMLVAHGRDPFEGDRKVLVAMTGQIDNIGWVPENSM